jgi:protein NrfC
MANVPRKASRRDFLKVGSASLIGLSIGALFPGGKWLDNKIYAIPASEGYLLVDIEKCQGCNTCMIACSLAHEGKQNLSLSRIQIQQNPYKPWPNDLTIDQCRQCTYPACVEACPTNALHADENNGNIRLVSEGKCIGCQRCLEACPYETTSTTWNHIDKHSQKCDLCLDTPFWDRQGGPSGSQACVKVCPMDAIKFTKDVPTQMGNAGYKVNLRGKSWEKLRYKVK